MNSDLPKSVHIMGHKFEIEPLPKDLYQHTDTYGDCCCDKRKIRVYLDTHKSLIRDTLLHEILHGAWAMLGLESEEEEERVVNSMSTLLIGLIDDPRNTEVVQFILNNETNSNN